MLVADGSFYNRPQAPHPGSPESKIAANFDGRDANQR